MENEELPKTGRSSDWLAHADKVKKKLDQYRSVRGPNHPLLGDDQAEKSLIEQEKEARKMGIDLLRKERTEQNAATLQKIRQSGRQSNNRQSVRNNAR
jgi:hypothetical protein